MGALLEAKAWHGGRSAYNHLRFLARTNGIPKKRVGEVLDIVGLHDVASKRAKGYSLGMGQRLGIAAALLGDPGTLMFDEPVNGLDPEGILWIRRLMQSLAAEGRTVFVSSHLMSEMAVTAGHLIVIGRGRILADTSMADFIAPTPPVVRVRSPDLPALGRRPRRRGAGAHRHRPATPSSCTASPPPTWATCSTGRACGCTNWRPFSRRWRRRSCV